MAAITKWKFGYYYKNYKATTKFNDNLCPCLEQFLKAESPCNFALVQSLLIIIFKFFSTHPTKPNE